MRPVFRHSLRIAAVAVFVILAPIIVLFALGYRYTIEDRQFHRVGMLVIESEPRDVLLSIDGKNVAEKTPHRATSLIPNDYRVRIEKEGYVPWEKSLFVESQLVTWVRNIILFHSDPEKELLTPGTAIAASSSPQGTDALVVLQGNDQRELLWLSAKQEEPQLLSVPDDEQKHLKTLQEDRISFSWTKDGDHVLLSGFDTESNQKSLIIRDHGEAISFIDHNSLSDQASDEKPIDMKIDAREPEKLLFLKEAQLIQYNPGTKNRSILQEDVRTFTTTQNTLFVLRLEGDLLQIQDTLLGGSAAETISIGKLPDDMQKDMNIRILPQDNMRHIFLASDEKVMRLDTETLGASNITQSTLSIRTHPTENRVAYSSQFEAGFISLEEEPQTLDDIQLIDIQPYNHLTPTTLARLSEPIREIAWHPKANHIAIQLEDHITITETDGRDQRNMIDIPSPSRETPSLLLFHEEGEWLATLTPEGITRIHVTEK